MNETRTIKLTDAIRDEIVSNAMDTWHKNNPEPPLSNVSYKLAKRVLHESYGNSFDAMLDLLAKDAIRGKFLNLNYKLNVLVDGDDQAIELSWGDMNGAQLLPMPNPRSMPLHLPVRVDYDEYRSFDVEYQKHCAWMSSKDKVRSNLLLVLQSVNTVFDLLNGWPEIKPYLDSFMIDPTLFVVGDK